MFDLPSLTAGQYSLAFNMFSFTIAAMLATFVFLYSIADVLAKAGYGIMIYAIARARSDAEGYIIGEPLTAPSAANRAPVAV